MKFNEQYIRDRATLNAIVEYSLKPVFIRFLSIIYVFLDILLEVVLLPWYFLLWLAKFFPPEIVSSAFYITGIPILTYIYATTEEPFGLRSIETTLGIPWYVMIFLFGLSPIITLFAQKITDIRRRSALLTATAAPIIIYGGGVVLGSNSLGDLTGIVLWLYFGLSAFSLSAYRAYLDRNIRVSEVLSEIREARENLERLKKEMGIDVSATNKSNTNTSA